MRLDILKLKNCKYFIDYLYNNHKVKLLHTILPKASAYLRSYDGQTNEVQIFMIKK